MQHPANRSRTRARVTALALALTAAGATALSGCGKETQTVGTAPPPRAQDAFTRRAAQIVRDWPKVAPVPGRHDALLPLAGAARPGAANARELTVTVGHSACDARYGARAQESEDLVVVTGWGRKKSAQGMCTAQLATDKVTVRLKAPLGGRTVVDAATGKRLLKG
ncbi:hypothetical protein ADL22_20085 [Streptomyces sp. NRRL F-4489]|uniref:hypothetical protein n=1 Tax=Streptomyces sp. NRRL F-4489 TaxID=1609095 RepID=UPI00074AA7DC|nr:hypothetical protein [Streptomyces sp. NRRL F-4489]KUL37696.1 hypothetical protein ADL22_20085 [Streptomyces sp. NRRL F-4489]